MPAECIPPCLTLTFTGAAEAHQAAFDVGSHRARCRRLVKSSVPPHTVGPVQPFILSNNDVRVPRIIYGTAWKKSATAGLVSLAVQNGFRGIDTACQPKHYDEAGVGAGIAAGLGDGPTRTDLYLQTKFTSLSGQDPDRVPYDPKALLTDQVAQSISVSLQNLQTDYLDCVLLHSPMPTMAQTLSVWRALESLVKSKVIRQIGISNCYDLKDLTTLYEAARFKPAVVQNRFYADTHYDKEIRAYCDQQQIIYQSFWTLSANPHLLAGKTITALCSTYKRTPVQILFRYLTQIGIVPLTGTKSELHMREDRAIFDFELSSEERRAIHELL
jgi:diketogulonate reductase-like aldo/keto reductase